MDHDDYSNREIKPHSLYGNNFNLTNFPRQGSVFASVEKNKLRHDTSTFDVIFYLVANLFQASLFYLHLLHGLGILFKKSFDHLVEYGIRCKLSTVLCSNRVVHLIKLIEGAIFEPGPASTELEKRRRKEEALENFQNYLRPFVQPLCGRLKYENGTQFVFDALQDPLLNKQVSYNSNLKMVLRAFYFSRNNIEIASILSI